MVFWILFISIGLVCVFLSWICFLALKKNTVDQKKINDLTVVVPFKDEENRISALINSVNDQMIPQEISVRFIFVDDHSEDSTISEIIKLNKSFEVLSNQGNGKKAAIKTGVMKATSAHILTLDADVILKPAYFQKLYDCGEGDLTILPVKMSGETVINQWSCIEFDYLQMLTFGFANLSSPILCNGANLLFQKQLYLEALKIRDDQQVPSGDDYFLLQAARKLNADIRAVNNRELEVVTTAPATWNGLLNQRKRWIAKINNTPIEVLGGMTVLFYQSFFWIALALCWLQPAFLIFAGVKLLFEWIILSAYSRKIYPILPVLFNQFLALWYYVALLLHKSDEPKWELKNHQAN